MTEFIGFLYLSLGLFGAFASYRALVHNELFWHYPNLAYRKKAGYPGKLCKIVGIVFSPVSIFLVYLGLKTLIANN